MEGEKGGDGGKRGENGKKEGGGLMMECNVRGRREEGRKRVPRPVPSP